jgi:hypothetical protein
LGGQHIVGIDALSLGAQVARHISIASSFLRMLCWKMEDAGGVFRSQACTRLSVDGELDEG